MRIGARYECPNYGHGHGCDRGVGRPTRKRCRRCKAELLVIPTLFGVFRWTASARYPAEHMLAIYSTWQGADAWIERRPGPERLEGGGLVVRYVDPDDARRLGLA